MQKTFRRCVSLLLILMMAISAVPFSAIAATSTVNYHGEDIYPDSDCPFETAFRATRDTSGKIVSADYGPLNAILYTLDDGTVAYCIQHHKNSPHGVNLDYTPSTLAEAYAGFDTNIAPGMTLSKIEEGIKVILQYGYPNVTTFTYGGYTFTGKEAYYITANAIRCWEAETLRNYDDVSYIGMNRRLDNDPDGKAKIVVSMAWNNNLEKRAKATAMLAVIDSLIDKARNNQKVEFNVTLTPVERMTDAGNMWVSKIRVNTNAEGWQWDTEARRDLINLPARPGARTGVNGDVITIEVPKTVGYNVSFNVVIEPVSRKAPSNFIVTWPSNGNYQTMIDVGAVAVPIDEDRDVLTLSTPSDTRGKGYVVKKDGDTGLSESQGDAKLLDARFSIYANAAITGTTYVKDSLVKSGVKAFEEVELYAGSYYLVETTAGEGYKPDATKVYFSVTPGATTEVTARPNYVYRSSTFSIQKYLTDADGTQASRKPEAGAVFRVSRESTPDVALFRLTTDDNGQAMYEGGLPYGRYVLIQEQGDTNHALAEPVHFSVTSANDQQPIQYVLDNKANYRPGSATFVKTDADTGLPASQGEAKLLDARFSIYADEAIADTDYVKDGLVRANVKHNDVVELNPGKYYLVETTSGEGYKPINGKIEFTVVSNQQTTVTIPNEIYKYKIRLYKYLNSSNGQPGTTGTRTPESGAVFEVKNGSNEVVAEITTNGSGYAETSFLPYGQYTLHQKSGRAGYTLCDDRPVVIGDTQPDVIELDNYIQTLTIKIYKKDADTGLVIPLEGAAFEIKSQDGSVTYNVRTDASGAAIQTGVSYGTYIIRETAAPAGYLLNTETKTVILDPNVTAANATFETEMTDKKQVGRIGIYKYGEQFTGVSSVVSEYGPVYTPVFTSEYLGGAVFKIYAAETIREFGSVGSVIYNSGALVESVTSSASEVVYTQNLPLGKYRVVEDSAPNGYKSSGFTREVTLSYNANGGEVVEQTVSVTNEKATTRASLLKQAEIYETVTEGDAVYTASRVIPGEGFVFGLYAAEALTTTTGSIIPADGLVAVATSDVNGNVVFNAGVPFGQYYVKELRAPAGFILDDTRHAVDFSAQSQDISVDLGTVVNRERVYPGYISKKDLAGSEEIDGAIIEIRNEANTVVVRGETRDGGKLQFVLKPGRYTYKETFAPEGYVLNEETFSFTIREDGTITGDREIRDDYARYIVKKTDTNGQPLAGAVIGMYDNGRLLYSKTTGADGIVVFEPLARKTYTVKEITPPQGYVLSVEELTFTVDAQWRNSADNVPNATIRNTENEYVISKTSTTSAAKIAGATIVVTGPDNVEVFNGLTNDKGEITLKKLVPGTYKFKETYAPEGYALNTTEYTFTVAEDGSITGDNTVTDQPVKVVVRKVDGSNAPLAGVKFGLYNAQNEKVDEAVSDRDGLVVFLGVKRGTWTIKEIETVPGYKLSTATVTVTVDGTWANDNAVSGEVTNEKTVVTLQKNDDNGVALADASITVYNAANNEVFSGVTDRDGKVVIIGLPAGKYTFKETAAPDTFALNTGVFEFEIDAYGNVTGTTVITDRKTVYIVRKTDAAGTPLANAVFGLYKGEDLVATATSDSAGNAVFTGFGVGSYNVREITPPAGYTLNKGKIEFTVDEHYVNVADSYNALFKNDEVTVTLSKTDLTSAAGVPGAEITIYNSNGDVVAKTITDNDGKIVLNKLVPGTYTFKETVAPNTYALNTTVFTFTVGVDGSVSGDNTVTDEHVRFQVYKRNESSEPLAGVKFGLVDENGQTVMTAVSNEAGLVTFEQVPQGAYSIVELETVSGYQLSDETFDVRVGGQWVNPAEPVHSFVNKETEIVIIKEDKDGNRVSGMEFVIYNESDAEIYRGVTGEDGTAVVRGLPVGKYTVREVAAPETYALDTTVRPFEIDERGQSNGPVVFVDDKAYFAVKKTDETGAGLKGAVFGLYVDDVLVVSAESDENGYVFFSELRRGEYVLREITPPAGYTLNPTQVPVSITAEHVNCDFANGAYDVAYVNDKVTVTITKKDLTTSKEIPGATITITNANGEEVVTGVTDENGKFIITGLHPGKYQFREVYAPVGYKLNETVFEFEVDEDGTVHGDDTISDEPTRVVLSKYDVVSQEPVAGAEITIYNEDGEEVYRDVTNEDGAIECFYLPAGKYTFKETLAPEGYARNTSEYHFVINEKGEVSGDAAIADEPAYYTFFKVDENGEPLVGVRFGLYNEQDELIAEAESDENGLVRFDDLKFGLYTIKEIEAPEGYQLTGETIILNVDGTYTNPVERKEIVNHPEVKTGMDKSNVLQWMLTISAAALLVGILAAKKRKEEQSDNA